MSVPNLLIEISYDRSGYSIINADSSVIPVSIFLFVLIF